MELITQEKVEKSVQALLKHLNNQKAATVEKTNLLEVGHEGETDGIYLSFALKKIPEQKIKTTPIKIPLIHPFRTELTQVALITKDPQREYKDLIATKNIKSIQKVIGVTKLRNKYKPYEAKRLLCASFDLFLADDRILPLLPKLLGKEFYKKKKMPTPIDLTKPKRLKEQIDSAINSAHLFMAAGPCQTVKIAVAAQSQTEIVENIMSSLPHIVSHFPKKWKNVQSVHLKSARSLALPLYHVLLTDNAEEQP